METWRVQKSQTIAFAEPEFDDHSNSANSERKSEGIGGVGSVAAEMLTRCGTVGEGGYRWNWGEGCCSELLESGLSMHTHTYEKLMSRFRWECLKYLLLGFWTDDILCSFGMLVIKGPRGVKIMILHLVAAVIDAYAFELPKAVAKFACASARCSENAENIINHFVKSCNPRDMVSFLCEIVHKMATDDEGSDSLNRRGRWNTVRLDILKGASVSNEDGVISNSNVDDNVERRLESRNSSLSKIRVVSNQLIALSRRQDGTTHALKGLTFISKNENTSENAWDNLFDELTRGKNGLLKRSDFGRCIGMNAASNDFAEDLFDSLCRRRNITGNSINKEQFMEFWAEIDNPSFDSRLQIFLDMVDKDKDGRITKGEIREVASYPSGDEENKRVLALRMTKPEGFKYKSGQYMFLKCSTISPFEWHPFSITTAPGDDYLGVHIRDLGDWTKSINKVFLEHCSLDKNTGIHRADFSAVNSNTTPEVRIDGPYGAPSHDYKNYEVVLLVGLGIGATPMISIVKNIVNNIKAKEENENALEDGSRVSKNKVSPTSANEFRTKKAYFYWVSREQESFDWFEGVMDEIAQVDKYGVIEMHIYCSSVFKEGDARSALVTMLQSLNHKKNGVDVVSGTRFKSHFGRPKWLDVCNRIATNHPGSSETGSSEIGVFYCGQQVGMKDLKQSVAVVSRDESKSTKFVFHKENF
ncbi:hypothetical protein SSX86_010240 [Deinandra increscens subsp. villosa]|uniref:NADPH oxidase n=1 Tax=Deinandra increscens subsp. villosa TaxID=3103831 RepID=A0AAP0D7M8_9ASTR